jgi:hypothetical protein
MIPTDFGIVIACSDQSYLFVKGCCASIRYFPVGQMVALRGTEIELVPLADAVAGLKTVTPTRLAETLAFTG